MPVWVLGLVPLPLVVGGIALFMALSPGAIELTGRNDGADAVSVAQVVVNDAFAQFSGAENGGGRGLRGRASDLHRWNDRA